jgi:Lon protease-like protein
MDDLLLPLFPLEIVLLPEEPLPLHIFEERYKQMVGECLQAKACGAGSQEFGVVLAKEREIHTVGCTARIINVTRKYADGRLDIFTVGHRRFEVLFTDEAQPYLRGSVEYFDDDPGNEVAEEPDAQQAVELFREAMQRLRKSSDMPIHFPRPYRHLSFRMAGALPLDLEFKQQILCLRDEKARLAQVTRAVERLIAQWDMVQKVRSKAGGNGNTRLGG